MFRYTSNERQTLWDIQRNTSDEKNKEVNSNAHERENHWVQQMYVQNNFSLFFSTEAHIHSKMMKIHG